MQLSHFPGSTALKIIKIESSRLRERVVRGIDRFVGRLSHVLLLLLLQTFLHLLGLFLLPGALLLPFLE